MKITGTPAPEAPDFHNRALAGAWRRGWSDADEHGISAVCPYPDKRTASGKVTFSRAMRNAWAAGFDAYAAAHDPTLLHGGRRV